MSEKVLQPQSGELPPEKLEILRQLDEAFHGDKKLIAEYLAKYGWSKVVSPNIRVIRREHAESAAVEQKLEEARRTLAEDEPTGEHIKHAHYSVDVGCPICGTRFHPAVLRSKALILSYDYKNPEFPLLVPDAKAAMKGYRVADPLLRAVMVCPQCLFASCSLGCFYTESAVSGTRGLLARLHDRKLDALRKLMEEDRPKRLDMLRKTPTLPSRLENMWGENRTMELAITAFRLAAHCSEILAEYDPTEIYRSAESLLSAAKIAHDLERESEEMSYLAQARPFLEKSFQVGSVSALPVYLLGVVLFHLGDDTGARTWIGRVLTDRGNLVASIKYKRYCENLNEYIKARKGSS